MNSQLHKLTELSSSNTWKVNQRLMLMEKQSRMKPQVNTSSRRCHIHINVKDAPMELDHQEMVEDVFQSIAQCGNSSEMISSAPTVITAQPVKFKTPWVMDVLSELVSNVESMRNKLQMDLVACQDVDQCSNFQEMVKTVSWIAQRVILLLVTVRDAWPHVVKMK